MNLLFAGGSMDHLLEGIKAFRKEVLKEQQEFYTGLKRQQQPHTLFITCSDSRISPNEMTGTRPGELFVIRNVANIVPPYRVTDEYVSTTSAIEYAVKVLKVKHIIICGHSNCGGCAAGLHQTATEEELPHTKKWLELLDEVREKVIAIESEPLIQEVMMEEANVLAQLEHLRTFPEIIEGEKAGELNLHGWYYDIGTGKVLEYDEKLGEFVLLNEVE